MSSWRLAGRLARRQARRRPARTALILGLIGLPVAGVVVGTTAVRTTAVRSEQTRRWSAGNADAVLLAVPDIGRSDGAALAETFIGTLPPGSRAVVTHTVSELVRRPDGSFTDVEVGDGSLHDPLLVGTRILRSGRVPAGPGEAAVSPPVLRAVGAAVGDTITLARSGSSVRITGTIVDPAVLDRPVAVVGAGLDPRLPGSATRIFVRYPPGAANRSLTLPDRSAGYLVNETAALSAAGASAGGGPGRLPAVRLFGGVALAVTAIVAAAAFAVGQRRHLRDLGLLSAAGARPNHLVRIMAVEGIVLGVAGAAAGVALGLLGVAALSPFYDGWANHVTGGARVAGVDVMAVAGFGVVASALAAWTSARTAYWLPPLAALAGHRPLGRVPRYVPLLGLGLAGAGIGLIAWVGLFDFGVDLWQFSLAGAVATVLGATALTPWIVSGLEPLSRRFRGTTRLALRSLARQRVRSAAVVAAVMAAGALTVGGSTVLLGGDALSAAAYPPGPHDHVVLTAYRDDAPYRPVVIPEAIDATVQALPGATYAARSRVVTGSRSASPEAARTSVTLRLPAARSVWPSLGLPPGASLPEFSTVWADGPGLLDALGAPGSAAATLASADAVVFMPRGAAAPLAGTLRGGKDTVGEVSVAVVPTKRADLSGVVVMAPRTVTRLGLGSEPTDALFRWPRVLTAAQRRTLDDLNVKQQAKADAGSWLRFEFGRPGTSSGRARSLAAGAALLFTGAVIGLGLALIAAESRQERALLRALGAPPRAVRRTRVIQAVTLSGLGGVLAVPVGFGATAAYLAGPGDRPVLFPTAASLAVALVIPLVVALAASLPERAAGSRLTAALLSTDS